MGSIKVKVSLKSRSFFVEELTITEVARKAGLRPSAIRYYESVNLLPEPRRVSGRRRYDAEIVDRLAFIQVAQRLGFTLTEIQTLFQSEANSPLSASWQTLARQKLTEVDLLMQRARTMRKMLLQGLRCDCTNLPECIDCVLSNCANQS
jgi:MerR family redox-sensitive transcriptional activator SoxR